jgi:hypothetical protein
MSVACGGQLRFGKMISNPQWEYCVRVYQRQYSLHQFVPKEISCTDFLVIYLR